MSISNSINFNTYRTQSNSNSINAVDRTSYRTEISGIPVSKWSHLGVASIEFMTAISIESYDSIVTHVKGYRSPISAPMTPIASVSTRIRRMSSVTRIITLQLMILISRLIVGCFYSSAVFDIILYMILTTSTTFSGVELIVIDWKDLRMNDMTFNIQLRDIKTDNIFSSY